MSDPDQDACYAAEAATGLEQTSRRLTCTAEARTLLESVLADPVVRKLFPAAKASVDVKFTTNQTTSWSSNDDDRVRLGMNGRNAYVALHEMAHQLTPGPGHGVLFRICLLCLVRRFIGVEAWANLKYEFARAGLTDNLFV